MKRGKHIIILLLLLLSVSKTAAASDDDSLNLAANDNFLLMPVATVGPIKIYPDEFISGFDFGPAFIRKMENPRSAYLKYMINEKLLALYGLSIKLDTLSEVKEIYEAFSNDLTTEKMFREEILPKVEISEDEIDTVINQKILHLKIKWIFYQTKNENKFVYSKLNDKIYFDSVFTSQFKNGAKRDE
jgi:hypothetical protein